MINILDFIMRNINPLGHAKKHGMQVGKGVSLVGKKGTSFGSEPYLITLEDEVRMSGGVRFITHDGGTWAFRDMEQYKDCGMDIATYGAIYVGKRSFIGYGATIMPGVKIGQRCVIGAGAIVTHDIPDNSIAVGVPAKVISTMEDYANKCMATHKAIGYDMNRLATDRDNYLVELKNQGKLYNDKKRIFK